MKYILAQWKQDKLRAALVIFWLLSVISSFFGAFLLPITVPGIGTWFAFRTLLPITAILYLVVSVRDRVFFWTKSTALEKWCYVFMAVLFFYGVASLPRAIEFSWTFRYLFNLCYDLCFFFLLLQLCREKDIRRLTLAICAIMWVFVMVLGIYEVFFGGIVDPVYNGPEYQDFLLFTKRFQYPVVFFGNTNDYAMLLAFFYTILFLLTYRDEQIPKWCLVPFSAATYFLLLAASSELCLFAFLILLMVQVFLAILKHQKEMRRYAAWMILCVVTIQFCNQYRYIVPPIQTYLEERAAYEQEQSASSPPSDSVQEPETPKDQEPEEPQPQPQEAPELQIGDPRKQTLEQKFYGTNETTGEKELRTDGSGGIRARLLIHALGCFRESHGLGVGLGNTEILARDREVIPNSRIWGIHCFLARILADYGIFVLIPLCMIVFLLLKNIFGTMHGAVKNKNNNLLAYSIAFLAALVVYPIISTVSSDAQDNLPMWIYLAMIVLLNRELNQEKQSKIAVVGEDKNESLDCY